MTPQLRLMIVDDEPSMLEWLSVLLSRKGFEVQCFTSPLKALEHAAGRSPDIALVDLRMPGMDGIELLAALRKLNPELVGIVMTAYSSIDSAVKAMRQGASDYLIKPFEVDQLMLSLERSLKVREVLTENRILRRQVRTSFDFSEIAGKTDVMLQLLEQIRIVADKESTVIITGESGTGKELVARAIHYNSRRSSGPFLAVNCGSFTSTLLESELFGHVNIATLVFFRRKSLKKTVNDISDSFSFLILRNDTIELIIKANNTTQYANLKLTLRVPSP